MSPERLQAGQVDARTDIYALACVLYECLTGSPPYPGDALEQQVTAHLTAPPPRPSITDPNVPVAFDSVIATGMAKQPDQRYPTTVKLAHAARDANSTPIPAVAPTMWARPPLDSPAATQLRPPPPLPQSWPGPPTQPPRGRRALWGAIAGTVAVIAVVITVVLVIANRDGGAGSASAPSSTPSSNTPAPNTGPFTGTFTVDFGPTTDMEGAAPGEGPAKETWKLRSMCGGRGCVATARRMSGDVSLISTFVFDDVGGRWLAVAVTQGNCGNADVEVWEVFSLQPRPDGALSGEFSYTSPGGECVGKRTVTFTRTEDVRVDSLDDPAGLPTRVVSPAEALRGRYHYTRTFNTGAAAQEYDLVVRTDCLRSGDRCTSFFHGNGTTPLMFANGRWTQTTEFDGVCPLGGTSHVTITAEYPLPQPPQDPIAMLTGHGHQDDAGSACSGGDFEEKFARTGN